MTEKKDLLLHILELKGSVSRIEQKVDVAMRAIEGNGQPGLRQRVEALEGERSRLRGFMAAGGAVLTAFEFVAHRIMKW